MVILCGLPGVGKLTIANELAEQLDRRVASVERSRLGKIHSAGAFRRLRGAGAFPLFTMPAGTITIDTTGLSVPQAAALVAARLNHASSAA